MSEYRLNDPEKGIIGPVRLETVRDLMEAGVIPGEVLVSKDNGPFVALAQFSELSGLVTPARATRPTYAGDIGKNTFFKVFYRLHLSRISGRLVLESPPAHKDVYLVEGAPVQVSSNVIYERLGEFLALHGLVKRRHLEKLLAEAGNDEVLLGNLLLQANMLTTQQLLTALRNQAVFNLVDLCLWENGRYMFFENVLPSVGRFDLKLAVPDLIIRAARQMPERALLRRLAPHFHHRVVPTSRFRPQVAQLRFSDAEKAIIHSFDGKLCVADIAGQYGDDPALRHAALVVIYLLWEIDAVSYTDKPSSSTTS